MKTLIATLIAVPVGIHIGNYAFVHQSIYTHEQVRMWNMSESADRKDAGAVSQPVVSAIAEDGLHRKARLACEKGNRASSAPSLIADLWNITPQDLASKVDIFGERTNDAD